MKAQEIIDEIEIEEKKEIERKNELRIFDKIDKDILKKYNKLGIEIYVK